MSFSLINCGSQKNTPGAAPAGAYTSPFDPVPLLDSSLLASLAQVQEVARARWVREEGFQAAWQSEEDRRRLEMEE